MNKPALWICLGFSAVGVVAGCATTGSGHSYSGGLGNSFNGQSAQRLLGDARATIAAGNQVASIPQLHEVIARYPGSKSAIEAHYLLGVAYYDIDGYRDAIEELNYYLEAAPSGEHAEESRALVERLSSEYRERFPSSQDLDAEIASLQSDLTENPDSIKLRKRFADRLWLRGRYDEAGSAYLDIVAREEAFKQDPIFRQRVELRGDGSHVLLTPAEIMRREIENRPISVINLTSFRSGRDRRTQVPRYFVVTGQALNRSDSVLSGVEIDITIYGFGAHIYDTKRFTLGDMYPSETRAFSVRFSNFRELNSIDRYDYSIRFRR